MNNEPAFPVVGNPYNFHSGMTLRDYFAAKAMQGLYNSGEFGDRRESDFPKLAYEMADAMLKEREK